MVCPHPLPSVHLASATFAAQPPDVREFLELLTDERSIPKIVTWYESQPWARGLVVGVPFVGKSIHEYLISTASQSRRLDSPHPDNTPYNDLIVKAFAIDSYLLGAIRSMSATVSREILYQNYRHLLKGNAVENGVDIDDLLSYLGAKKTSQLFQKNFPKPDLEIACNSIQADNIGELKFLYEDRELANIKNTPLLWPCNCKVKKFSVAAIEINKKIDESNCPIHSLDREKLISKKFNAGLVQISFDDVRVLWRQSEQLWPPSVDAFHMVEDIKSSVLIHHKIRTIADIGCGTGFIGIWMANKIKTINDITFSDWLLSPLILTALNASLNLDDTLVKRHYYLGLDTAWVNKRENEKKRDLLVCNPPYLPNLTGFPELPLASTVFGTDLIENIIRSGHKIAKEVIIAFSDLALPEARIAAQKWGKTLEQIGKVHRVPFRVAHVYEEHEYLKQLIDQRGLEYAPGDVFPLYHSLRTYRILS